MTILDEAVALAGVDPRQLHALLMAGTPERTIELARAFEDAGRDAREAYERGRRAHAAVADGFANDGAPVLDAAAQNDRAWRLLGQGGQDMDDTATFLKRSVAALDDAQAASTRAINRMVTDLNASQPGPRRPSSRTRRPPRPPAGASSWRRPASSPLPPATSRRRPTPTTASCPATRPA